MSVTPYTTPAQVRQQLSPDGSNEDYATAASLDDATLQGPCDQASDEVDAALGGRYSSTSGPPVFPIEGQAAVPDIIVQITTGIASYLATLLFRKGQPMENSDPVLMLYQRCELMLQRLANGTYSILVAGQEPGTVTPSVVNPYRGSLFVPEEFQLTRGGPPGRFFPPFPR